MKYKFADLSSVKAALYRASQSADLADAIRTGAAFHMEETYGYTSTLDSLINMARVANSLSFESHKDDLRIVLTVDGVDFPECSLNEAYHLINSNEE